MNEFDELISLDGILMAGRFDPDWRIAEYKSASLVVANPQALQMAQNDPGVRASAAYVLARFGEDIGTMIGCSTVRSRSTRALLMVGFIAAFSGSGPVNPIAQSSMSKHRCG